MTLSLQTKQHKPPRILIYGPHGLGKSTFGALSDSPVFIQTEDGLATIDAPAFPLAKTYADVMAQLTELATIPHKYKTVVVDSADWLEPLIWAQVATENNTKNIEAIGYGKGYTMALDLWREYISALNYLRDEKHMTIIQTAHAHIKRYDNPETESYDRMEIKLHKGAAGILLEHSDIVLFCNYFVGITKEKKGFDKDGRKRAVGSGERILYTTERPTATAKNRYGLPEEIPFDKEGNYWNVLATHIPFYNQAQTQPTKEKDAA